MVGIQLVYEVMPILWTCSHHTQNLTHSCLELIDAQEAILGRIYTKEHLFHVDKLLWGDFEGGKERDNSRLEHILFAEGCHVLNDVISCIIIHLDFVAVVLEPGVV